MSARKRSAAFELTSDNYEGVDEEVEDRGAFTAAPKEEIKKREIITAKRRTTTKPEIGLSGALKGFTGFAQKTPALSFLTRPPIHDPSQPLAMSSASMTTAQSFLSQLKSTGNASVTQKTYQDYLQALNEGVRDWIKSHVDKNPFIDLTPIFNDYQKHLADIEMKYGNSASTSSISAISQDSKNSTDDSNSKPLKLTPTPPVFKSLGSSPFKLFPTLQSQGDSNDDSNSKESKPLKLTPTPPPVSNPLGSSPFKLFPTLQSQGDTVLKRVVFPKLTDVDVLKGKLMAEKEEANPDDDDDDDGKLRIPEKVTHTVDDDLDVMHSVRAKLFYKDESDWKDIGVGNLKLVKTNTGKIQMLLRSDTAIGKILLNVHWSEDIPTSRQGKNNVMMVCSPNPPIGEQTEGSMKPVSYLIRVKTIDDADELYQKLTGK